MGKKYATNWIVCIAHDLWSTAQALETKAKSTGQGPTEASKYPVLPSIGLTTESRITIVAHGDETSSWLVGDKVQWDAKTAAEIIGEWSQKGKHTSDVRRISFHMCYGGRAKPGSGDRSFARDFASYCFTADEVVGRTGTVNLDVMTETSRFDDGTIEWQRDVYTRLVNDIPKGADRKIVYLPRGGTPKHPVQPGIQREI